MLLRHFSSDRSRASAGESLFVNVDSAVSFATLTDWTINVESKIRAVAVNATWLKILSCTPLHADIIIHFRTIHDARVAFDRGFAFAFADSSLFRVTTTVARKDKPMYRNALNVRLALEQLSDVAGMIHNFRLRSSHHVMPAPCVLQI